MTEPQLISLIGQLGASGIFALALAYVARAFYNHLLDDIQVMRQRIAALECKLDDLHKSIQAMR